MQAGDIHDERLLIVDFGSQYTQLIARRVREAGVYCEIRSCDEDPAALAAFGARGLVLSGGPESAAQGSSPRLPDGLLEWGVPVLGICYGMQAMAVALGGQVAPCGKREFGHAVLQVASGSRLLQSLDLDAGSRLPVWMSHGDQVRTAPPGFRVTGATENAPIAAMEHASKPWFGLQFHPEVTHTRQGAEIYRRFAREICGCARRWTVGNIAADAIASARTQVGGDRVVLGLSGGVDSSVTAALLSRALGDQLSCLFVDNGLLRKGERQEVQAAFSPSNALNLDLTTVDAADAFFAKLAGLRAPEAKRKAVGGAFIEVFEREANKLPGASWLAQGTIYPDVIESAASGGGKAHVIKSHHNVGGLPEQMGLRLIEPLRELFKDEVRELGLHLGLPRELLFRHPFPGPGLAVRVLGEVTPKRCAILREADAIFIEELRKAGHYDRVSQAFAVYLPVKSVGVMGDARRYAPVIALRAVETLDFMTARWAHLPYDLIERVSSCIVNQVAGVSRVVYDVSSKPPATIEWE